MELVMSYSYTELPPEKVGSLVFAGAMNDHRLEGGGFGGRLKPAISAQAESVPAQAGLSRRGLPVRGSLPLNGEGRIVVMALVLNVGFDHLIGDVATAAAKIATRPHVPSPVALPNRRKLPQQQIGVAICNRKPANLQSRAFFNRHYLQLTEPKTAIKCN